MTAAAFLKLQRSGFTEPQVEALAEYLDSQAATRADLVELRADLSAEIAALRAETQRGLAELERKIEAGKNDVLRWVLGVGFAQVIAVVGAVLAIVRFLPGGAP